MSSAGKGGRHGSLVVDGYGMGPKWSKAKAKKPQIDESFSKNLFRNHSILVELSKFDRSLTHTSTQVLRFSDSFRSFKC